MALNVYTPEADRIIHNVRVDMTQRTMIQKPIHLVQYDDKLPIVAVSLYKDGQPYFVGPDYTASVRWGRHMESGCYNKVLGANSTYNIIYFEVTQAMAAISGASEFLIELLHDGKIGYSGPAASDVHVNPVSEGDIEKQPEYTAILEYVAQAEDAANRAEVASQNAYRSEEAADNSADISITQADRATEQALEAKNQADRAAEQVSLAEEQVEEAKNQVILAEAQALEAKNQADRAAEQVEESKNQAALAEEQAIEAKNQADAAKDSEDAAKGYAEEAKRATTGIYKYKGSVPDRSYLPSDPNDGDTYNIVAEQGMNVAWSESEGRWDELGSTGTMSIATVDDPGAVKPDGTSIVIDADGTIHGVSSASDVSFDNEVSGLESENVQDAIDELAADISEIRLFKFPNAVIHGEPTLNNGQISGFSNANYLVLPSVFDLQGRGFEFKFAFTTNSDVTLAQNILGSKFCMALFIQNGKLNLRVSSNGTDWNVVNLEGSATIEANKTYYVKINFTRLNYAMSLSLDDETYNEIGSVSTGDISPKPSEIYIGIGNNFNNPFKGIINLNKCYLKVNQSVIWQGMDDAGLSTRLATDLENIDEAGVEKIKEIVNDNIAQLADDALNIKKLGWTVPSQLAVKNYIGTDGKFHKKVGRKDARIAWNNYGVDSSIRWLEISDIKKVEGSAIPNLYHTKYTARKLSDVLRKVEDNIIAVHDSLNRVYLYTTDTTPTGYLYYELATEEVLELDGQEAGYFARKNVTTNSLKPTLQSTTRGPITINNNGDGTFTLNGTNNTGNKIDIAVCSSLKVKKGTQKLIGCPSGITSDGFRMKIIPTDGKGEIMSGSDRGEGFIISASETRIGSPNIIIESGATISNLIFKPMLTTDLDATYVDFVPYTGDTGNLNGDLAEISKIKEYAITPTSTIELIRSFCKEKNGIVNLSLVTHSNYNLHASTYTQIASIPQEIAPKAQVDFACATASGEAFAGRVTTTGLIDIYSRNDATISLSYGIRFNITYII